MPGKVRGRPFQPGNPGRPPGSRNKTTQVLEQLAERQAEQIFQKVLEGALSGDVSCQRMLLDRLWPLRKGQPINVDMPPINTPQDVFPAIVSIWKAMREGCLTAEEATALSVVIDRSIQAIQLHGFKVIFFRSIFQRSRPRLSGSSSSDFKSPK